jgi:reactive chlorine resistance protein C
LIELLDRIVKYTARLDRLAANLTRLGLVLVTLWIGGLKVTNYESESIVPFVANSPLLSWLLKSPGDYKRHQNPEGAVNAANENWHMANGTYTASLIIGAGIVLIGILIACGYIYPLSGVLGGLMLTAMSLVTLSFLITTPEAWVPALGSGEYGFPFLAGPGRLVVKDAIMLGAALWTAADSAKQVMTRHRHAET